MAATDSFSKFGLESKMTPADHVALGDALKSDTVELNYVTRGVSFGVAGDIKVVTQGGETVTIPSGALVAGVIHPIRIKQIYSTGTTATSIVLYW